ncbi:YusW family protein [Sporosarcina sp. E16_8]|uniref:YusW family protein n=1 Tax=Sporosarcina sp. E16_8 TaxID=2789295 RepID=UPI001A92D52D|nr:YusW family protein [Sporosarcina sp. E16_8]MBO0586819.1 YusW family protein [Sporosarcina sp. E16_8]
MRKLNMAGTIVITGALLMSGCGNFGKNADKPNREDAVIINEAEKAGGSIETGNGFGFTSFDLEIDVDGKDAIDADYDVAEKANADYENKLTNVKLKDNKAMDELNKMFIEIRITKDTPQQEVIDKVLQWFGLETYSKFDLEVDFDDGTLLDIEDLK